MGNKGSNLILKKKKKTGEPPNVKRGRAKWNHVKVNGDRRVLGPSVTRKHWGGPLAPLVGKKEERGAPGTHDRTDSTSRKSCPSASMKEGKKQKGG